MLFEIVHTTDYRYSVPASEAYIETRLTPPHREDQEILAHAIDFAPAAPVSRYVDYFGNVTTFYSMTLRHERMKVTNRITARTRPRHMPTDALALTLAEARQIFSSALTDIFYYLQPTPVVPTGGEAKDWAARILRSSATIGESLEALNREIFSTFTYRAGATDISTPTPAVWKKRAGVCQDFAHVMLGILRTGGLPARYVCGYIETDPPAGGEGLVGAVATHAWVEVMVPGFRWVALDPTNNQWCGERHLSVAFGRDFDDATPVRGTFKGSGSQSMSVAVHMKRLSEKP